MIYFLRLIVTICLINGLNCISNNESTIVTLKIESICTENDRCPVNSVCDERERVCLCNFGYQKSRDLSMCHHQAQPKRVGDACQDNDIDCWDFKAQCSDEKICECYSPLDIEDKDGHCVETVKSIANCTCVDVDIFVNRNCNGNNDCKEYRALCSKDGKCFCKMPDRPSNDKSRCQGPTQAGDLCEKDADCNNFAAVCYKHHCKCAFNHFIDINNDCVQGIEINRTCTIDNDCLIYNAKCLKNNHCYCTNGTKATADDTCQAFYGMSCTDDNNCASMDNSHCEAGKCICNPEYILNKTDSTVCNKRPTQFGDNCYGIGGGCDAMGGMCYHGLCDCAASDQIDMNKKCVAGVELNRTCDNDDDCKAFNGLCSLFGKCFCAFPAKRPTADLSMCQATTQAACNNSYDCSTMVHSVCSNGRCDCMDNFIVDKNNNSRCYKIPATIGDECQPMESLHKDLCLLAGEGMICGDDKLCRCPVDQRYDNYTNACIVEELLTSTCENDGDCPENSYCSERRNCSCDRNSRPDHSRSHCLKYLDCIDNRDCQIDANCIQGFCICKNDRIADDKFSSNCLKLPMRIGESCMSTLECTIIIPNSHCTNASRCSCDNSYEVNVKTGKCHNPNSSVSLNFSAGLLILGLIAELFLHPKAV